MPAWQEKGKEKPDPECVIRYQTLEQQGGVCGNLIQPELLQEVRPRDAGVRQGRFRCGLITERERKESPQCGRNLCHGKITLGDGPHFTGNTEPGCPKAQRVTGAIGLEPLLKLCNGTIQTLVANGTEGNKAGEIFPGCLGRDTRAID